MFLLRLCPHTRRQNILQRLNYSGFLEAQDPKNSSSSSELPNSSSHLCFPDFPAISELLPHQNQKQLLHYQRKSCSPPLIKHARKKFRQNLYDLQNSSFWCQWKALFTEKARGLPCIRETQSFVSYSQSNTPLLCSGALVI